MQRDPPDKLQAQRISSSKPPLRLFRPGRHVVPAVTMDDWDDIVRDAGEDHFEDTQDAMNDEADPSNPSTMPGEAGQKEKTEQQPADAVDHDTPATDEEQCRICFCGAEEEPELGVS